jgi:predicted nucleic acid-binding protein
MIKLVIDSSAWIEYFRGSSKGQTVRAYLKSQHTKVFITGLIASEILTKFLKEGQPTNDVITALENLTSLIQFDFPLAKLTAELFVKHRKTCEKFGIADAHVLAAAKLTGCRVLTCDNDFRGIPEAKIVT